jgi:hypothetical protein
VVAVAGIVFVEAALVAVLVAVVAGVGVLGVVKEE